MKSVSHSFHLLQWGLRCHISGGQVSCVDVQEETILAATDLPRVGWVHVEEVQLKRVVDDDLEVQFCQPEGTYMVDPLCSL